jgi:hypothetical protein
MEIGRCGSRSNFALVESNIAEAAADRIADHAA